MRLKGKKWLSRSRFGGFSRSAAIPVVIGCLALLFGAGAVKAVNPGPVLVPEVEFPQPDTPATSSPTVPRALASDSDESTPQLTSPPKETSLSEASPATTARSSTSAKSSSTEVVAGPTATQRPTVTQRPIVETTTTAKPNTTTPPATNPPATKPPATNPPATRPPVTNPPATKPPVTRPPATKPPTTRPPTTRPTTTAKPSTTEEVVQAAVAGPAISGLYVQSITSTSADIRFTNQVCTAVRFDYSSPSGDSGAHVSAGYPSANHCWFNHSGQLGNPNWRLPPLQPNTRYNVSITVVDKFGQTDSASISFTTKP